MIAPDRRVLTCAAPLARAAVPAYPPYPAVRTPEAVGQWIRAEAETFCRRLQAGGRVCSHAGRSFRQPPGRPRYPA